MKIGRKPYNANLVMLIASLMLLAGCGGVQIRASDSMFQENSIKKIAVLSTARVEWPRMAGEPVLGLAESKQALETLAPVLRESLVNRGYQIVFSEPTGIGYYNPSYKRNWVAENYAEKGDECKKWQVVDRRPAFEYPAVQNNQEFCTAAQNIFEQIELAISRRQLNSFTPSKNDLEVIRQATGADTVCLYRVYGQKFTTRRKVTTALIAAAAGTTSTVKDTIVSFLLFVNASSGEVLWQHGLFFLGKDPANPEEMVVIEPLRYFPKINETMDPKCKKKDPIGPIYECRKQ
jgi:hypothetical protein